MLFVYESKSLPNYWFIYLISASELEIPEDGNDEVDVEQFWGQVCLAMVYRGFHHAGN